MGDSGRRHLEVGTLSADGSRRWDGTFWVLIRPESPLDHSLAPVRRSVPSERWSERRTFGLGGVILAALVAIAVSVTPIPVPSPGSLESALREMAIVTQLRFLVAFGLVVVILSVGRRGIDVLLLRAMLVAFILGSAFFAVFWLIWVEFSIPITPRIPWFLVVLIGGLIASITAGPLLAVFVILANLLWYRSFRSMRPQLGIFSRRRAA